MTNTLSPIGVIHTPYKEKFAVPRQPRLVPDATAHIQLLGEANSPESVRGLDQFSHVWVLFLFDQNMDAGWKPTVRPPRLGGNERIGVFASRSTFRPNGIGMSAIELKGIKQENGNVSILLGSTDLVDQTPIIDIKPYIPYSDAIIDAKAGYAQHEPNRLRVLFSETAQLNLMQLTQKKNSPDALEIQKVIEQVLSQDPRPAYKKNKIDHKEYAVHLFDFNVKFMVVSEAEISNNSQNTSINNSFIRVTAIEDF